MELTGCRYPLKYKPCSCNMIQATGPRQSSVLCSVTCWRWMALSPGMDKRNANLIASFPTPFFGRVDSKGHSRFVLRISNCLSHRQSLRQRQRRPAIAFYLRPRPAQTLSFPGLRPSKPDTHDRPYHIATGQVRRVRHIILRPQGGLVLWVCAPEHRQTPCLLSRPLGVAQTRRSLPCLRLREAIHHQQRIVLDMPKPERIWWGGIRGNRALGRERARKGCGRVRHQRAARGDTCSWR